jgi:hypothetical protein
MKTPIAFLLFLTACPPGARGPAQYDRAVVVSDAGTSQGPTASWVLDFDGHNYVSSADPGSAAHVNHGYFWPPGADTLGPFTLQAWVMPRAFGSRYYLSDGYGGAHSILAGFTDNGVSHFIFSMIGNHDGTQGTSVTGATAIAPGTWVHVITDWDGIFLRVRLNGVLDGKIAYSGLRGSAAISFGGGEFFVGGSTHSNFNGRIAEIELWEGFDLWAGVDYSFLVERRFRSQSWDGSTLRPASFLAVYTTPMDVVPDLSSGYNGGTHAGTLFGALNSEDRGCPYCGASTGPIPTWQIDYNAPTATAGP